MKKWLLLAVIVVIGFMTVFNTDINRVQALVDVNESNYRVPLVGGSTGNPAYEITRFDCAYGGQPHRSFGEQAMHVLIDINVIGAGNSDEGVPVYSSGNGTVILVGTISGLVQIENTEMGNYYGHMVKIYVTSGQSVVKGQLIGLMGNVGPTSTGSHLHWETYPMPGYSFDPTQIQGVEEEGIGTACTNPPRDGYMWGQSLSNFVDCAQAWNQNTAPVLLFDAPNCQGNAKYIPSDGQVHHLAQEGFDNRTRSIYMHGDGDGNGISVLMGPDSNNLSANNYCWHNDMWNTDADYYFSSSGRESFRIGWDGGIPSANNMISWVQVHNNDNCSGQGNNILGGVVTQGAVQSAFIGGGNQNGQYGNSAVDIREDVNCVNGQYGWNNATSGVFNLSPDVNYMDNKTTCIDVDYGFSVMVYNDANGLGASRCFNHTVSDLQPANFNDGSSVNNAISSVQVFTNLDCGGQLSYGLADGDMITVWENDNYSGQAYGWHTVGNYNFANFGVSSIGVMDGWSVLAYENANLSGAQMCITTSDPYLNGDTYSNAALVENNIDSIQIFHDSNCGGWSLPTPTATPAPTNTPVPTLQVTSLVLVNADTEQDIAVMYNNMVIDTAVIGTANLNIRAETNPAVVGSLRFALDGNSNYTTQNSVPYTIGDDNGVQDYYAWNPGLGQHTITATPYIGADASGTVGAPLTLVFQIGSLATATPPPTITSAPLPTINRMVLVRTDTNQDIGDLYNGYLIDTCSLGTDDFSVRAEGTADIASVMFGWDGNANFHNENTPPYTLNADDVGPVYFPITFAVGSHTISARPYTQDDGGGVMGATVSYVLNVVGCSASATDTSVPNTLVPTSTNTDMPTSTFVPTNTSVPAATATNTQTSVPEIQLMASSPWVLTSQDGASEMSSDLAADVLVGRDTIRVIVDLNGLCALGGDASAIVFNQSDGWHYVALSQYVQNCFDGAQTIEIPITDFGLLTTEGVSAVRSRFWNSTPYSVEIISITAFDSPNR